MKKNYLKILTIGSLLTYSVGTLSAQEIEAWVTNADRSMLFQRQSEKITFGNEEGKGLPIIIDDRQEFQTIDGFGFALTEGSAFHLHHMSDSAREQILKEMFGTEGNHVGFSYIRLTLGASDLNNFVYSYNDLPDGKKDLEMKKFDLGHDYDDIIPVMKEILKIVPDIKIMASPWSAPVWMRKVRMYGEELSRTNTMMPMPVILQNMFRLWRKRVLILMWLQCRMSLSILVTLQVCHGFGSNRMNL